MDRRTLLSTLGMTVGAAAFARTATADHHEHTEGSGHGSKLFNDCAAACDACARECSKCYDHCSEKVVAGHTDHAETMNTCNDCAAFCSAAATLCARQSDMAKIICESCIKACEICAKACEQFPDDQHMQACAKECRKCAEACKEMVEHADHV